MSQNITELFPDSLPVVALGRFRFDVAKMLLSDGDGRLVKLRSQSARVLQHLAAHAGSPVSKAELIETVWQQKFVTDDSLTQCISELRRKISDKDHRIIETFPKIGYQLNCADGARFEAVVGSLATQINLVIRPFEDVSAGSERGQLGSAITEEVSVGLSQCCDFFLSTLPAGAEGDDIGILADKYQIHYVLEGSQQKVGDRIRVTARLIDANSQQNIWAQVYDRDLESSHAAQTEIVERIVIGVVAEISEGLPSGGLSENCAVYFNLKSRPMIRRLNRADNLKARELNLKAVEVEPLATTGHIGLAIFYHWECAFNWCDPADRADYLRRGIAHIHRAIELDRYNETAHRICALLHLHEGDWDRALQRLSASLEINPNRPLERGHMTDKLSFSQRGGETSAKDIENAISIHAQLDGLHCWISWRKGDYLYALEKFQARPVVPVSDYLILAATHICLGQTDEGRQAAQTFLSEFPAFNLAQEREVETTKYDNPDDLERWIDALRAAGVPETAPGAASVEM